MIRMSVGISNLKITRDLGKGVECGKLKTVECWIVIGSILESSLSVFTKIEDVPTLQPSNSTCDVYSGKTLTHWYKEICIQVILTALFVVAEKWETT